MKNKAAEDALEIIQNLLKDVTDSTQLGRAIYAAQLASDNNLGAIVPIVPETTPPKVTTREEVRPVPMEVSPWW